MPYGRRRRAWKSKAWLWKPEVPARRTAGHARDCAGDAGTEVIIPRNSREERIFRLNFRILRSREKRKRAVLLNVLIPLF